MAGERQESSPNPLELGYIPLDANMYDVQPLFGRTLDAVAAYMHFPREVTTRLLTFSGQKLSQAGMITGVDIDGAIEYFERHDLQGSTSYEHLLDLVPDLRTRKQGAPPEMLATIRQRNQQLVNDVRATCSMLADVLDHLTAPDAPDDHLLTQRITAPEWARYIDEQTRGHLGNNVRGTEADIRILPDGTRNPQYRGRELVPTFEAWRQQYRGMLQRELYSGMDLPVMQTPSLPLAKEGRRETSRFWKRRGGTKDFK